MDLDYEDAQGQPLGGNAFAWWMMADENPDWMTAVGAQSGQVFYNTLGFYYPPEVVAKGKAPWMTMDVGYALHLVASLEESADPALAAALRRFANIHYIHHLVFEFELPDNSPLALLEFSSLDPREVPALTATYERLTTTPSAMRSRSPCCHPERER